mmetsp:Transcript_24661/g.40608  ORF Transcript_24661/g.40608 Transcript_24661/m.40608 type:complete len:481 (-) Transcript_24661:390-1832(-)|eukprot:CAMPEP_0184657814 /NCGR_PEP_ID=MMETSP0308-20130426/21886_1 /TAXON_ID=38269 /ORGANISM="Gloeochaete witrockiana, Strain SAG 46.84" /LENGTH=480 /DNA_ID=CAMNT_0027096117 /DNA_START=17 /DNA_END=1459 /DNA_ORIENTATION=-
MHRIEHVAKKRRIDYPDDEPFNHLDDDPFNRLDDDLIAHLFSFVGTCGIECVRTLSPVCRRFRSVTKLAVIWARKVSLHKLTSQVSSLAPAFRYPFSALAVPARFESIFNVLSTSALECLRVSLKSLDLEMTGVKCPARICDLSALEELSLTCRDGPSHLGMGLNQGDFEGLNSLYEHNHDLTRLSCLHSLDISDVLVRHSTLKQLLETCPIQRLSFACVKPFADMIYLSNDIDEAIAWSDQYIKAISIATDLRFLFLALGVKHEYRLENAACLSSLTCLRQLSIFPGRITGATVALLLKSLPYLDVLFLDLIIEPFPDAFPVNRSLRALRIVCRDVVEIDQQQLDRYAHLLYCLPSLQNLSIRPDAFMAHREFHHQHWPNLKVFRLYASDLSSLTEEMVQRLECLPSLRYLEIDVKLFVPEATDRYKLLTRLSKVSRISFESSVALIPEYVEALKVLTEQMQASMPACAIALKLFKTSQ